MQIIRSRWWLVALFGSGIVALAALWSRGRPGEGAVILGVASAFTLVGLAGERRRRSRGEPDERSDQMEVRAAAFMGFGLMFVLFGGVVWRFAEGRDAGVFRWLLVAGVWFHLAALFWQRRRG
jgi:hypothetical protein